MSKIIIAVVVSLFIGGGIGYQVAPTGDVNTPTVPNQMMLGNNNDTKNTMDSMTANLKNKKGEDLDIAFLEGMIVHHQGAIEMAKIVLANSKRPELQKMAQDIISAQSGEITTMETWLNQWFGR